MAMKRFRYAELWAEQNLSPCITQQIERIRAANKSRDDTYPRLVNATFIEASLECRHTHTQQFLFRNVRKKITIELRESRVHSAPPSPSSSPPPSSS